MVGILPRVKRWMIRGGGVCGCLRGESWRGLDVWALREPTSVSTGGALYAAAELTTSVSTGSGFRRRSSTGLNGGGCGRKIGIP